MPAPRQAAQERQGALPCSCGTMADRKAGCRNRSEHVSSVTGSAARCHDPPGTGIGPRPARTGRPPGRTAQSRAARPVPGVCKRDTRAYPASAGSWPYQAAAAASRRSASKPGFPRGSLRLCEVQVRPQVRQEFPVQVRGQVTRVTGRVEDRQVHADRPAAVAEVEAAVRQRPEQRDRQFDHAGPRARSPGAAAGSTPAGSGAAGGPPGRAGMPGYAAGRLRYPGRCPRGLREQVRTAHDLPGAPVGGVSIWKLSMCA